MLVATTNKLFSKKMNNPLSQTFPVKSAPPKAGPAKQASPAAFPTDNQKFYFHKKTNLLYYPNSKIISSGENNLILESTDNPSQISNWYKNQIRENKWTITSFIETATNNEILNKMVASRNQEDARVTISKSVNDRVVKIEVIYGNL